MRLALPALNSAQIQVAKGPEMGVESIVKVSVVEAVLCGKITVDASGNASWAPEPGLDLGATGMDLHLKVNYMATASLAPSVTLNCTLADDTVGTAIAALTVPSWFPDQSKTFQEAAGEDFIPQGAGNSAKLVKAISGATVTNVPNNAEFLVYASPLAANFKEQGWKRGAEGAYNVPSTVSFPEGYNPSRVVKAGRGEERELTLEFAHIAAGYALGRYNGKRVSVLIEVKKNRHQVHTTNVLYIGYIPSSSPSRTDGNDEVKETSRGKFEDCVVFDAK
jgi:hypothetical protein